MYKFIFRHTLFVLAILFLVGISSVLFHLNYLADIQVKESALQSARAYTKILSEFRSLYTSEVVAKAKANGTKISHEYKIEPNAIPLPITFTILLGDEMSRQNDGMKIKLYSPFPFPWRTVTGGLTDQFSRDAWQALDQKAENEFFKIEVIQGRTSLRFATPDIMTEACVDCHNSYLKTPKSDWKVGDMRGILEVIVPVQSATIFANNMVSTTGYLLSATLVISLLCIAFVLHRLRISTNRAHLFASKTRKLNKSLTLEVNNRRKIQQELLLLSLTDPLTGIANRRKFEEVFDKEWLNGIRHSQYLSLIMIDIDYFKLYNDNYGHQLGDETLQIIAQEISMIQTRPTDLAARYGGEEFVILLPDTDINGAMHIGKQLLASIRAKKIPHAFSKISEIITISAGVACMVPSKEINQASLLKKADEAMYLAKNSGRNCIKSS